MKNIRILTTGGTIEGYVAPSDQDKSPLLPQLLENARLALNYQLEPVFAKDSRAITDDDRKNLLKAIRRSNEEHILISHGTITICETAQFLGKQNINKRIVLVGAMVPADQERSDAEFNLGTALMALSMVSNGVYVVMNCRIFDWNNVIKNTNTCYFEELS